MTALLACASLLLGQGNRLEDGGKFKNAFNAAKEDLRVVIVLAPTCATCLNGAKDVQDHVLTKVKDDRLKVFIIWAPAYGTDSNEMAIQGTQLATDKRVRHFWDAKSELALDFGKVVTVPRDSPLAYDVYFIYQPGTVYKDKAPVPFDYLHQILDGPKFFEPEKFVPMIQKQLDKLPKKKPA